MRLMQTPRIEAANGEQCGLSWIMRDVNGTWQLRHGGATNGQLSAFIIVPSRQWAITILTNADMGRAFNTEISTWALQHYLGFPAPKDDPIESAPEDLQPYVGHYTGLVVDLTLYMDDGKLFFQEELKQALPGQEMPPPEPPITLARYAPDKLVMLDGPLPGTHIEFIRDPADNRITWLRVGGRIFARQT
jgi:hypothetical protein